MKRILSLVVLFTLAVPAVAQDGLVDRVARLEAKVDKLIALLEKQSTPQLAQKVASPAACPCVVANGFCPCADPFSAAQAVSTAPAGYRMVCNGNSCTMVPINEGYTQYQSVGAGGGCANGSCGTGLFGRIFRRR